MFRLRESNASIVCLFSYGSFAVVLCTIITLEPCLEELLQKMDHAMPTPGIGQYGSIRIMIDLAILASCAYDQLFDKSGV